MATRDERLRERTDAAAQRERYDNLAHWSWRVLSNDGKDRPGLQTEAMLRDQMVSRRMLRADGTMREDRMRKFMDEKAHVRSKKPPNLPYTEDAWEPVLEGMYP